MNNDLTPPPSTPSISEHAVIATQFERQHVEQLLRGEMPITLAMDFLRHTSEKNLDAKAIALFVDVLGDSLIDEAKENFSTIQSTMDCCGTGGSGLPHFNTSTTVAFVLAAAGVPITKFGNRAANSLSGSFDFLERLGLGGAMPVQAMPELFKETNLLFIFAQQFYPALATIAPVRQTLGVRTIFNLIGPLLNPVKPTLRLLGTPNRQAQELIANYLAGEKQLTHAYVVTSANGLDELEIAANNYVTTIGSASGSVNSANSSPGIVTTSSSQNTAVANTATNRHELVSGEICFGEENYDRPGWAISADECASIFMQLMNNEIDETNYFFRTVCLNAAAGFVVAGQAKDIPTGYEKASLLLKEGEVTKKFEQYRSLHAGYSN